MTAPNPVLVTIPENLGVSFELIVLMVLVVASWVLFAKDFKLGLVGLLVTLSVDVIVLIENGLNYVPGLVVLFMVVVMMAFSLLASANRGKAVGGYMT